jgi:hypothetical protein
MQSEQCCWRLAQLCKPGSHNLHPALHADKALLQACICNLHNTANIMQRTASCYKCLYLQTERTRLLVCTGSTLQLTPDLSPDSCLHSICNH